MQTPPISCVLCRSRKVKCDKRLPSCTRCVDVRVECIYQDPKPPRRRRRRTPESVRRYRIEQGISREGAAISVSNEALSLSEPRCAEREAQDGPGATKDVPGDTNDLPRGSYSSFRGYNTSSDSETDNEEVVQPPSRPDALLLGTGKPSSTQSPPSPEEFERLWHVFLKNVNPLMKSIHVPSTAEVLKSVGFHYHELSKAWKALSMSICLCATSSEVYSVSEDGNGFRSPAFSRYQNLATSTLIEAGYLRTVDLVVLQAFSIYLFAIRPACAAATLWSVSGVAVRIAQKIGLHSEANLSKRSPFEAEICRRLWHSIIFLDGSTGYLTGLRPDVPEPYVRHPLNLNDGDLYPSMGELPAERDGATEMVPCLVRCCLRDYIKDIIGMRPVLPGDDPSYAYSDGAHEKYQELQDILESRFLRHCDPLEPLDTIMNVATRSALCNIRIRLNHPGKILVCGNGSDPVFDDSFLDLCIKSMEYENVLSSTPSLKGYLWHFSSQISVNAMAYLLSALRTQPEGDLSRRAWNQIQQTYLNRPCLFSKTPGSLYHGLGMLTLAAWNGRQNAASGQLSEPSYIIRLKKIAHKFSQQSKFSGLSLAESAFTSLNPVNAPHKPPSAAEDTSFAESLENIDWDYWNSLMMDYQMGNSNDFTLEGLDEL